MKLKCKNKKYKIANKILENSLGAILLVSACSIGTDAFGMDLGGGWSAEFGGHHRGWRPQSQQYWDNYQKPKKQEYKRPRALVEYPVSKRVEERHITGEEFNQLQAQGTQVKFYGRTRSNGQLKRIDYGHYLRRIAENRSVKAKIWENKSGRVCLPQTSASQEVKITRPAAKVEKSLNDDTITNLQRFQVALTQEEEGMHELANHNYHLAYGDQAQLSYPLESRNNTFK
jgi:hypothetical protein